MGHLGRQVSSVFANYFLETPLTVLMCNIAPSRAYRPSELMVPSAWLPTMGLLSGRQESAFTDSTLL